MQKFEIETLKIKRKNKKILNEILEAIENAYLAIDECTIDREKDLKKVFSGWISSTQISITPYTIIKIKYTGNFEPGIMFYSNMWRNAFGKHIYAVIFREKKEIKIKWVGKYNDETALQNYIVNFIINYLCSESVNYEKIKTNTRFLKKDRAYKEFGLASNDSYYLRKTK
jgi:hypothetical protein